MTLELRCKQINSSATSFLKNIKFFNRKFIKIPYSTLSLPKKINYLSKNQPKPFDIFEENRISLKNETLESEWRCCSRELARNGPFKYIITTVARATPAFLDLGHINFSSSPLKQSLLSFWLRNTHGQKWDFNVRTVSRLKILSSFVSKNLGPNSRALFVHYYFCIT